MIDIMKYIAILVVMYGCIWMAGKLFADSVSDYEVIKPKAGVECVVRGPPSLKKLRRGSLHWLCSQSQ